MQTFKFNRDVKYTIWRRESFIIEADTKEEAVAKAKNMRHPELGCCYIDNVEWLPDTAYLANQDYPDPDETVYVFDVDDGNGYIADNSCDGFAGYKIMNEELNIPDGLSAYQIFEDMDGAYEWMSRHNLDVNTWMVVGAYFDDKGMDDMEFVKL